MSHSADADDDSPLLSTNWQHVSLPLPHALAVEHFERRMRFVLERSQGLDAAQWDAALADHRAVELAQRQMLGEVEAGQTDWTALDRIEHLDWSLEFVMRDPECIGLFSDEALEIARRHIAGAQEPMPRQDRQGRQGRPPSRRRR